ncbi:glycosyltransferase family 2 protein [Vibrio scophthalmi]|uniref:glycosyltransferase family 2 protein n=1 Tax=Vibrio scophthalmi TaxID=45658 RepID=UPI00349FAA99
MIPYYGHEKYIEECIMSVINQSYKNFELIVIDDGSPDEGYKVISKLARLFDFKFIRKPNEGVVKTLNLGLSMANGEYFCALGSDDVWLANKLDSQVYNFPLLKKSVAAISAGYMTLDGESHILNKRQRNLFRKKKTFDFKKILLNSYYIPALNVMWKTDILKVSGGFDSNTKLEDYYSFLNVTSLGYQIVTFNEVLGKYRLHDSNTSKNIALISCERERLVHSYADHELYLYAKNKIKFINFLKGGEILKAWLFVFSEFKNIDIIDVMVAFTKFSVKKLLCSLRKS